MKSSDFAVFAATKFKRWEGRGNKGTARLYIVSFDEEDKFMRAVMEANTVQFSAGKSVALNQELNKLARTNKDFNVF